MKPNRLEAFSDGVFAIIITIMVLELRPPAENSPAAIWAMLPVVGAYLLSFIIVGVHWLSHHRLVDQLHMVTPGFLWANLALLFWLSLLPFATANMGHHHWVGFSVLAYMGVILGCSICLLVMRIMAPRMARPGAAAGAHAATIALSATIVVLQAATTVLAAFHPRAALVFMLGFALLGIVMSFRGTSLLARTKPGATIPSAAPTA